MPSLTQGKASKIVTLYVSSDLLGYFPIHSEVTFPN